MAISTVANIAALRALSVTLINPDMQYVEGYDSGSDGGEGPFWYNSSDITSADNGGTLIVDAANRRWYRETEGFPYSVLWFGARGDGSSDDTSAIQAAVGAVVAKGGGKVLFPARNYPAGYLRGGRDNSDSPLSGISA